MAAPGQGKDSLALKKGLDPAMMMRSFGVKTRPSVKAVAVSPDQPDQSKLQNSSGIIAIVF